MLYLAALHCRGRYTLSNIAERLGPLTISGLDSARAVTARRMKKGKGLKQRVGKVERILDEKKAKSKAED